MEDESDEPKVQADNNSIAIGEINITGNVTGNITIGHTIVQTADAHLRHDLGILLKNVETTWIKGVLERSVHEAALLELGMELREEAVDNPWRTVIEKPDQSREMLPQGKKIKDLFDEANRLLLILGEPGSGKTTTLLQLARDLIAVVDQTFTQPIPVILNLSTWTNKQQPLDEWLIGELNSKYRLPKKDGKKWLRDRRILPLLDGLDEVKAENRAACVEKINQLVRSYGLQGIVVCSRVKDYTNLNVRLAFYRAIYLQPLTPDQIDEYLDRAGDKLASLRATIQADEGFQSLARSPLILNIMSLAYQDTTAEDLSDPVLVTDKTRHRHLFDSYIDRMFKRKVGARQYDNEQTRQRLSWLARNMQRHNQEVFLIEGLQPSWFQERRWQRIYVLSSRLIGGLFIGMLVSLFRIEFLHSNGGDWISWYAPLRYIPFAGLSVGFVIGLIDILRFERHRNQIRTKTLSPLWGSVIHFIRIWLSVVMISGTMGVILGLLTTGDISGVIEREFLYALGVGELGGGIGIIGGLITGLVGALFFGPRGISKGLENDIHTVEALHWSWHKALKRVFVIPVIGLILGLLGGTIAFLITKQIEWLSGVLGFIGIGGLFLGLLSAPIVALFTGLSHKIIETKTVPNQGIQLSIKNATLGGLAGGLVFGLIGLLLYNGTVFGLIGALSGVLWYGGLDIIQHYTLRLILIIRGYTPHNYARFLDHAVDRIFLQKVGGGYRFIHRLLLEHFADMDETAKKV